MKDSWITTKAKLALSTDGRTKARHISVETQGATVMLRGKVSSAEERGAAEEIARGISGVAYVNNALQIVPDDQRQTVDAKDDGIETAITGAADQRYPAQGRRDQGALGQQRRDLERQGVRPEGEVARVRCGARGSGGQIGAERARL